MSLSGDDGGGSYDDYRVVVDLESSSGKKNDYGKKGLVYWFNVCELISPFHDAADSDAGDDKILISEAYVAN